MKHYTIDQITSIVTRRLNATITHVVTAGETLEHIAIQYFAIPEFSQDIFEVNMDILETQKVYPGQVLVIPSMVMEEFGRLIPPSPLHAYAQVLQ